MSKTDPFHIIKTILKDFKVPLDSISNHNVVFYEKIEIPAHIIRIAFGAIDIYPTDFDSTGIIWSLHFTYADSLYTIESRKNGLILVGGKENVPQKKTILKKIISSAKVIDNNLKKILNHRVNDGDFLIYNTSRELMDMYLHFENTLKDKIFEREQTLKKWKTKESKQKKSRDENTNAKLKGIVITENIEFGKFFKAG